MDGHRFTGCSNSFSLSIGRLFARVIALEVWLERKVIGGFIGIRNLHLGCETIILRVDQTAH